MLECEDYETLSFFNTQLLTDEDFSKLKFWKMKIRRVKLGLKSGTKVRRGMDPRLPINNGFIHLKLRVLEMAKPD
jgi:hypothetical protein